MKKLILSLSLLIPSICQAGAWSEWIKVTEAYTHTNGHLYAKFETMINPDGCPNTSFMRVDKGYSESIKNRIYSTLLSSLSSGQKVSYYVSGCATYPLMTAIRITPVE